MNESKPSHEPYANVPLTPEGRARYRASEDFWTGPRLVGLTALTLGAALFALYTMAQVTSETYWTDWLIPG